MDASTQEWYNLYYERLIAKSVLHPATGCLLWTGASSKSARGQYGRIKVKLPYMYKSETLYCHRLMYQVINRQEHLPLHQEVSHLCHNSLCVKSEHLSLEPKSVNNKRRFCQHSDPPECKGHHPYPDCVLF